MQFSGKGLHALIKIHYEKSYLQCEFLALIRFCIYSTQQNMHVHTACMSIILLFVLIMVTCETAYVTACSGIWQPPVTAFEEYVPHY